MTDRSNIVFFGSDAICIPVLDYLHNEANQRCRLRAVISQPDRRQGRGKKLQPNPVAAWASAHGIELLQPEKPTRELAEWLVAHKVMASLVMAYGHFLPKSLREAAPHGMINFHASLLPQYRGASPVETALAMGDHQTGVCLMEVVQEMDAGGVADVEKVSIQKTDTGPDVRAKIGAAVVPLLSRNLMKLLAGTLEFVPQDRSQASFCRKITKEDGALDFSLSADAIDCRLRAFNPWPGGYFDFGGDRIKVGGADVLPMAEPAAPGTVLDCAGGVSVATAVGVIRFLELQRPGGRMLPAADFLNGYELKPGDILTSAQAQPLVH